MLWNVAFVCLETLALCNARHIGINPDSSSDSEVIYTESFSSSLETTAATLSKHILNSSGIVESSKLHDHASSNVGHILQSTIEAENNLIATNATRVLNGNNSSEQLENALKRDTERTIERTESTEDTRMKSTFETSSETTLHEAITSRAPFDGQMQYVATMSTFISDKHPSSADSFGNSRISDEIEFEKSTIDHFETLSVKTTTAMAMVEDTLVALNSSRSIESPIVYSKHITTKSNNVINHVIQLEDSIKPVLVLTSDIEATMASKFEENITSLHETDSSTHSSQQMVASTTHQPENLASKTLKDEKKFNNEGFVQNISLSAVDFKSEETKPFAYMVSEKLPTEFLIDKHMAIGTGVLSYTDAAGPKYANDAGGLVQDLITSTFDTDGNFLAASRLDSIASPSLQNDYTDPQKVENLRTVSSEIVRPKNVQPANEAIEDLIEQMMETLNAPKEVEELLEREIEESFNTMPKLEIRQNLSQISPFDKVIKKNIQSITSTTTNCSFTSNEILDTVSALNVRVPLKSENNVFSPEINTPIVESAGELLVNNTENTNGMLRQLLKTRVNAGELNVDNGIQNYQLLELKEPTIHVVKKANADMKTLPLIPEIERIFTENNDMLAKRNTNEDTRELLWQSVQSNKDYNLVNTTLKLEDEINVTNEPSLTTDINSFRRMTEIQDPILGNVVQSDLQANEISKSDSHMVLGSKKLSVDHALANTDGTLPYDQHSLDTEYTFRENLTNNIVSTDSYSPIIPTVKGHFEMKTMHNLDFSKPALENIIEKNNGSTLPENDLVAPGISDITSVVIPITYIEQEHKYNNISLDQIESLDHLQNLSNLNTPEVSFDMEIPPKMDQVLAETGEWFAKKDFKQPVYQGRSMISEELIVPQLLHIKPSDYVSTKVEFDSVAFSDLIVSPSPAKVARAESDHYHQSNVLVENTNSNLVETIVEAAELTTEMNRIVLAFRSSMPSSDETSFSHNQIAGDSIDSKLVGSRSLASDSSSPYHQVESFNLTMIIAVSLATIFLILSLLLVIGIKIRKYHGTLNIEMTQQQSNTHVSVPVSTEES